MKITIDNYESYLLDLAENNLKANDKLELELFLKENAHLMNTIVYDSNCKLLFDQIKYPDKNKLKKLQFNKSIIDKNNVTNYIIAYYENELNKKSINNLIVYLKNRKNLNKEFLDYSRVYLKPEQILFKNKENLYKKFEIPDSKNYKTILRIAATILLVISIYLIQFFNSSKSKYLISKSDLQSSIQNNKLQNSAKSLALVNNKIIINKAFNKKYHKKYKNTNLTNLNIVAKKDSEIAENIVVIEQEAPQMIKNDILIDSIETKPINILESEKSILVENNNLSTIQQEYLPYREPNTNKKVIFKLIQAGISFVNKSTGSKIELKSKDNSQGNYNTISFETKYLKIYTKVKN